LVRGWRNKDCIRKWMYSDRAIPKTEHILFITGLRGDKKNFYWLAKHATGEYLGVVYLNRLDKRNRNAYLGIYVNPCSSFTGKGKTLIDCLKLLGFKKAGLHTMKLEVLKKNALAAGFYKKHGFRIEGVLREFVFKGGRWEDVIIMGLKNNRDV
jgi:UDP-4-amino-4,6-dideoxy-N-acetyl-beta-L-altrosamine N-acetyltransferase